MQKLRDSTLLFLIKKNNSEITDICLAMKKRGFGMNRWNGVGGKVNQGIESITEATIREAKEEILVDVKNLYKVAELEFYFPHNANFNQLVHVYFTEKWIGEPQESEEMKPAWFKIDSIPFESMWADDIFWLPEVIKGFKVKARFKFGVDDNVIGQEVNIVDKL